MTPQDAWYAIGKRMGPGRRNGVVLALIIALIYFVVVFVSVRVYYSELDTSGRGGVQTVTDQPMPSVRAPINPQGGYAPAPKGLRVFCKEHPTEC